METTGPIPGLSGMLGRTKRGLEQKLLLPLAWAGGPLFFLLGGGVKGTTISLVFHLVFLYLVKFGGG